MKSINITTSQVMGAELHLQADGSMKVIIFGYTIEDGGNRVKSETLRRDFTDLSAGLQGDINGLMRELSQEYNTEFANEPDSTWVDL